MKHRAALLTMAALLTVVLALAGCGDNGNAFDRAADEDSDEACIYEVQKNLDQGNYNKVISASCANLLQVGAAYLGLAGFEAHDVVRELVNANDFKNQNSQAANVYLNNLVGQVTTAKLNNLDNATLAYSKVPRSADGYADARFYMNVISRPLGGLAAVKSTIDPDGDGKTSSCDINGNGTPDEVDASSCALRNVSGLACGVLGGTNVNATVSPLTFTQYPSMNFTGLYIQVPGVTTASCPGNYKQLTATDPNTGQRFVVSQTLEVCNGSNGDTWRCPYLQNGAPVDIVDSIESALTTSNGYLQTLVANPGNIELSESMNELLTDMCGADGSCTSLEVANYLQNLN